MSSKAMSAEDVKGKLLQGAFLHKGSAVSQLSDPIADTPMVVTLDQLRPYDHNPRLNRNPIYDQLKESIRSRGLDAPPAITRRPGETSYLIRNGGNTRLAIPKLLYAGLGKPQIERLTALRRSAEKTWRQHAGEAGAHIDFDGLFQDVLASFDDAPDFTVGRFQDELIHQMQQPLGKDYNWLKLDMLEARGAAPEPATDKPRRPAPQPTPTPGKEPTTKPERLIPPLARGC